MKIRKIFFLVVIFAILAVSLQVSPTQAVEVALSFGVEINQFWYPATFIDTLEKAEAADNHWLRYNGLFWSQYQPNNSSEFIINSTLEANLIAASAAGMEVILIIRRTPTWAQKYEGYYCGPIREENFSDFASFMVDVVERYSQPPYNVKYYELWNEPDEYRGHDNILPDGEFGCWGEISDATYYGGDFYGRMLKAVYPEVKVAVPEAQIVLGGLLLPCKPGSWDYCNMSNFIKGILYEADGQDVFDYANFHGYTTYDTSYSTGILMERNEHWWASTEGMVEGKLNYLKQVMTSYGVSKPILLTEAALVDPNNLSSSNINAFEAAKADYLVYVFVRNIAVGIDGTTWYHMDKYGWSKSGLLDSNNEPLQAYKAFQVMTKSLGGTVYVGKLSGLPTGVIGYEFKKGDHPIWVLFSENGGPKTVTKPAWYVHAYDLLSRDVVSQTPTTISFNRPIYIDGIPNTAPIFLSDEAVSAPEGSPFEFTILTGSTGDENFDVHTITYTPPLPDWLTFTDNGDGTATLTGAPDDEQVGVYEITLTVTDSYGLSALQTLTITIYNVNDPPSFTSSPVTTAMQGTLYTYNVTATDPDYIHEFETESLTITAVDKPSWLTIGGTSYDDDGTWTAVLSGTPGNANVGVNTVKLKVMDSSGAFVEQTFTITVANINDPPYFTSSPITTGTQDVQYTYSITATDPDLIYGDSLTISATTKPTWLTLTDHGGGSATLSGTPNNAQVGVHSVLLEVRDSAGLTDTQSFNITVANVNDPPEFTSTPVTIAPPGSDYTYIITATDPDYIHGETLTFSEITIPSWLILGSTSYLGDGVWQATLSGEVPAEFTGPVDIEIKVSDSGSPALFDTQLFTITGEQIGFSVYLPLIQR